MSTLTAVSGQRRAEGKQKNLESQGKDRKMKEYLQQEQTPQVLLSTDI